MTPTRYSLHLVLAIELPAQAQKKRKRATDKGRPPQLATMAATVSSVWAKPGAWALDAEEHEDELKRESEASAAKAAYPEPPVTDFPPLAAAAATKTKKKSKGQTLSLSDFTKYGAGKSSQSQHERLTHDEIRFLPTAPRERSAEELEQTRGFRNYGSYGGGDRSSRVSGREDSGRERFDMGPSRADEADDWSKTKRFTGGVGGGSFGGGDRREKVGFFGGSSRADDTDNWGSNKSYAPAPTNMDGGRRDRRMGFDSFTTTGGGADSDNWGKRKEERDINSFDGRSDRGSDRERKVVGFESSGAADSETWMKREVGNGSMGAARPRLNLQPRSKPLSNEDGTQTGSEAKPKGSNPFGEARPREEVLKEQGKEWKEIEEKLQPAISIGDGNQVASEAKRKGSNPFGEARPREEVLKEQGKDWKEIEEKLQAAKLMDEGGRDGPGSRRKGFGLARHDSSSRDGSVERSWRKTEAEDTRPASAHKAENGDAEKAEEVNSEKGDDAVDTN